MQYAPRVSTVTTDADWNFSNLDTNCSWFLRSMFQQRMIANYWKGILANITSLHSHQSIPTMNRPDGFEVSKLLINAPDSVLKVWCIKFRSKHSSVSLLCLLRNLMHQTSASRNNQNPIFFFCKDRSCTRQTKTNWRKSSNLVKVKSHELICHFIRLCLDLLLPIFLNLYLHTIFGGIQIYYFFHNIWIRLTKQTWNSTSALTPIPTLTRSSGYVRKTRKIGIVSGI